MRSSAPTTTVPVRTGLVSVFRNLLHHHVHQSSAGPATTFWGGIGAVRRDAFELVGGFDQERFARPSVEDIELGMRLTAAGTQIVLDPAIQGTHLKRWTLAQMVRTDLFQRGIPWVELLVESRNGSSALNLGWRHRLSTLAVLIGFAGLAARRPFVATGSLGTLVLLNHSFYALLARQRGRARGCRRSRAALAAPPDRCRLRAGGLLRHGLRRLGTDS